MRSSFNIVPALALLGAPALADDSLIAKGERVYKMFCSHCHGVDMVNPGTSSFDLRRFPIDQQARFYDSVKNGKGDMPAWGDIILPEEMESLWAYVATRGGKEAIPEYDNEADDKAKEEAKAPHPLPSEPVTTVADGRLTACLARNAGALSGKRHNGGSGFDYRLSEALAEALDLELEVTWFESEPEEESDPVRETYALLAYGLCDIVPSHPLYQQAVGMPPTPNATLPRWIGMPTSWDPHKHIPLEPVSVTHAYSRAEIGLAYPDGTAEPTGLQDLKGRRLALQQGTLSGAIALAQAPESVVNAALTFNPGAEFLWELETAGRAEVAIVDVAAYDAHLKHNPVSKLLLAAWRHKIGFDIGIAVLAKKDPLRQALNDSIDALLASGRLAEIADNEGVRYAKPQSNDTQPPLTLARLAAER